MKEANHLISKLSILLICVSSFIITISVYINNEFAEQNIDEMIFYLMSGLNGMSSEVLYSAIKACLLPLFITCLILWIPILKTNTINSLEISFNKKRFNINITPGLFSKYKLPYAIILILGSCLTSYQALDVSAYVKRITTYSNFIEDNYVSGYDTSITFPKEKRNLIILYVESLENSMIHRDKGGGWEYSVIPELEDLAEKNVNFSVSDQLGGALQLGGASWTVAGLVATTSGLPLKIPIDGNEYTKSSNFMAGAYTLGDVLKKEGYYQTFMAGSDFDFGGRRNYYSKHGDYEILDVNTAISQGKMLENERVWWGFDDTFLFDWAKEELADMATLNQPFCFSFLTANTHFTDGYLEKDADDLYGTQYENVYAYTSKQIADFVDWFEKQSFYDSTTLVILGDHLSMQPSGYFASYLDEEYQRTIYNAFINSSIQPIQTKNRQFTSLDIYPTLLASIGVEVEGNRLGLGTNLFSEKETLVEELGFGHLATELDKNSNYYNQNILQADYLNLISQAKEEEL